MRALGHYIPIAFAVAFLGIVPFVHLHSFNDPVQYPQFIAIVILGSLLAISLWRQPQQMIGLSKWAWWPLGGLLLLTMVSSAWALNPAEAWFMGARWMIACGFLLLTQIVLARWPDSLLLICKVLIVSLIAMTMIGGAQVLGIDPLQLSDTHHSPNGTQGNRNFFGSALMLGIPFAAYAMFKLRGQWRIVGGVAIAIMVTGIVVAGTRAALVPLLVGLVVFPPFIIWRRMKGTPRIIALVALASMIGLAGWSSQFMLKKKDARIHYALLWEDGKVVLPSSNSLDFRLISWHHTLQLVKEKPLTGHGAGNWKMHIQRLGLQSFDDEGHFGMVVPLHPHNEFLVTLSELGFPGFLLLGAIWVIGILGAMRMAINRKGVHDSILGACLALAWLGMFIDASFSFPLERPFHLMIFCIVLALSLRAYKAHPLSPRGLKVVPLVIVGLLLLAGIDIGARMQADTTIRKVREAKEAHQPQKVLKLRPAATNWATQLDPVAALSLDWYVAMAHAELQQLPLAKQAFERSALVSPHHLAQRSGYASLLDMTGQYAPAIQQQTALLQVFPNFAEGWLNLSIMHIHAGQLPAARAALAQVPRAEFPERYDQVDAVLKQAGQ